MEAVLKFIGSTSKGHDRSLLSPAAEKLIVDAIKGVPELVDMHAHLIAEGHGCCTHPNLDKPLIHPFYAAQKYLFKSAAGIPRTATDSDKIYIDKMVDYSRKMGIPVRHFILAMDYWYDEDGTRRPDKTGIYISNEYMMSVVKQHPDIFIPCISVNPYRKDALDELDLYAGQGVRIVKWLPNSMGMNPANPKCIPFYERMVKHRMVLLCHVGEEHSVSAGGPDQSLGNPLLLRLPLNTGVKVIAAHCASEGFNRDIEAKEQPWRSNFNLFLRLMDDPKYKDLLFADISAMTVFKRIGEPLITMLNRTDLHSRLVFGTDYPVPAIGLIVHTSALAREGYITVEQKKLVDEIFDFNPLLFDFVLKRIIRSPHTGVKFGDSIFGWNRGLLGEPVS